VILLRVKNPKTLSIVSNRTIRARLQSLLRLVIPEGRHNSVSSLNGGLDFLLNNPCDIVFIEAHLDNKGPASLLSKIRNLSSKNPQCILLISDEYSSENLLTQALLAGASGVLTEPFSEDAVSEVLNISNEMDMQGSACRLQVATKIHIASMFTNDEKCKSPEEFVAQIKKRCEEFDKINPGRSIESIVDELCNTNASERSSKLSESRYQGASKRVRQLVEGVLGKESK